MNATPFAATAATAPPTRPRSPEWDRAIAACKNRLQHNDWSEIEKFRSAGELQDFVDGLQKKYSDKRMNKFLRRCHRIIDHLRPFSKAIDVFVQSDPTVSCLVWGSIRVVLEIATITDEVVELVATTLEKVCRHFPRFQRLHAVFPMAPAYERALVRLYESFAEFSIYIINYLRTNTIKNIAKSVLGKLKHKLKKKSDRIGVQIEEMQEEGRVAAQEVAKTRQDTLESLLKAPPDDFSGVKPAKYIPHSKNQGFVGREQELKQLRTYLIQPPIHRAQLSPAANANINTSQLIPKAVVLHGLGGQGKSELALQFAYETWADFDSILWVAAETPQKTQTSFSKIARTLNMPSARSNSTADATKMSGDVLQWLRKTSSSWLVIFDNAPDEDYKFLQEDYWPQGTSGSILITTRAARLEREFSIPHHIPLGPLGVKASIEMLLGRLPERTTSQAQDTAEELANRLGHLPLALSQMSGYIEESGFSLSSLLATYDSFGNRSELHSKSKPSSTTAYKHTMATVWEINVALLKSNHADAARTLSLLAFWDPDGIPQSSLKDTSQEVNLVKDFQYLSQPLPWGDSIQALQKHHLVTVDRAKDILKIHRVLQDFSITKLDDSLKADAFVTTIQLLHHDFPTKSLAQKRGFEEIRKLGDQFYPHVLTALSRYRDLKLHLAPSPELYDLLEHLFWYLHHRGLYKTAEPYFEIARNIYNEERDTNLTKLAFLEGTLGTIHRNSDDAGGAVKYFSEEIRLYEEAINSGVIEAHNEKVAIAYEHMAVATQQLGHYDEAFIWHDKNLAILLKYYKDDVINLAIAFVNKCWALWKTGKLDEAEQTLNWVLATSQTALDVNSQDFQACRARNFALRVLGNVYLAQQRWEAAFDTHKLAFKLQVQTWGEKHFETGVLFHRIGCHYEWRGDTNGAIEQFRAALAIFETTHVSMESHIIRTRYKLGSVLVRYGDPLEGEKLMDQARHGRYTLKGIDPGVDDDMDAYDMLVPYWAW